jgi:hypothetical protein
MNYCYVCSDGAVAPARHCQLKDSSLWVHLLVLFFSMSFICKI